MKLPDIGRALALTLLLTAVPCFAAEDEAAGGEPATAESTSTGESATLAVASSSDASDASVVPVLGAAAGAGTEKSVIRWSRSSSINEYLERHLDAEYPTSVIDIPALGYVASGDAALRNLGDYQGRSNVLGWTGGTGWVEWSFTAKETGFYHLSLEYLPLAFKSMSIEFAVSLDGEQPFDDFASVRFPRVWKDASAIRQDDNGNELRPDQVEAPVWTERQFIDTQGFYNQALPLYVTAGQHRLRLELRREALALTRIRLSNPNAPAPYAEVSAAYAQAGYASPKNVFVKVQAEAPWRKSDSTLIPTYDRSNAATEPAHPAKIRLNTIGGNWTWKLAGQWVEWKVEAPEDGLYRVYVKGRQNNQRGMAAVRKISVDGAVPCAEFGNVEFPYALHWQIVSPTDSATGEPCLIYLTKGEHLIRLEATLGRLTPILTAIDDLTYEVNTLRRRFIMIMGSEPDLYRDYQLEKEIPGLTEKCLDLAARFNEQADMFEEITAQRGSEAATLRRMADQLNSFAKKPEYIPHQQNNFRDNIANLATWILFRKEIPFEADYLGIASADARMPRPEANWFAQRWMDMRSFFYSFVEDYNSIGKKQKGNVVNVWISAGRDQAQVLRDLINNDFTPKTGVKVNLSLVQGSLIEATLAGRGPEVAINVARGQPVNFASRNALYDLSKFAGYDAVAKRFNATALIPYQYRGGTYAIPMTQDFHMLFYRKDIFAELGIKPPQTWEDVYAIIPVLQRNNMQVGLPYQQTDAIDLIDAGMGSRNLFPTLLAQAGGNFYLDEGKRTGLTSPEAFKAFKQWTEFYSSYGFALKYDFYTRFRSGEMPIGIASYGIYNMLVAAAPEIRNEWAMIPIPGTRLADGTVNRSEAASGSATMMFKSIKNPEAGWEFLKWWSSADVQLSYATQLETLMGTAARLNTANLETFDRMPWSHAESTVLKEQWASVREFPEVPGGYYTIRMLDTAFSKVFYDNLNPRATLYKYCKMIDEELTRKRKELGL
jgi:ABC-type glycerol-3-phosphate transport system substrate-binding protein